MQNARSLEREAGLIIYTLLRREEGLLTGRTIQKPAAQICLYAKMEEEEKSGYNGNGVMVTSLTMQKTQGSYPMSRIRNVVDNAEFLGDFAKEDGRTRQGTWRWSRASV